MRIRARTNLKFNGLVPPVMISRNIWIKWWAIIGDFWLDALDSEGKSRLVDLGDFVRIEIESALGRGIPVIPIFVRGASMPPEDKLPTGLKKLIYRNGMQVRSDPDFHRDMDRLISALDKYIQG